MANKRKTRSEQRQKENKRSRRIEEHRLDDLPESLQLHILSFLDAKVAVQTSTLSKPWLSLWTSTPVLRLNHIAFYKLRDFDKFVDKVLRSRDQSAAKLNTLTFTRGGVSSAKILKFLLDYAFSHGVNHLELFIQKSRSGSLPVSQHASYDSLKTLILKSDSSVSCPFLSGMFENLAVLHLKGAIIESLKPFSGFPMLEKLVLEDCRIGNTLTVEAMKLRDLTISCRGYLNRCELATPNLIFFKYTGSCEFPLLQTHDGLPNLEEVVIDCNSLYCYHVHKEKIYIDDLISLLRALHNAKSVTLFSSIVDLLGLIPEKLVKVNSPFCGLKNLNVDLKHMLFGNIFGGLPRRSIESFEMPTVVKDYLLHKSPEAKFSIIYPPSNAKLYHVDDDINRGG